MSSFPPLFTSFTNEEQVIDVTPALVEQAGLLAWAASFTLGTAGYRDLLDPENLHNLQVPFNSLTLAFLLEARAQLAVEEGLESLHVGGEVRPHTQELIDLASRIYAAHDLHVHLRPPRLKTTPIWLSSFGVFYEELDGGENFTASHSQSYKGGWKPMNAGGGQLLALAGRIADRVRVLVARALHVGLAIRLAPANHQAIRRDFDPLQAYIEVLRRVVPTDLLPEVDEAARHGFRAAFCTEGGSMAATARRIFASLGIGMDSEGPVFFTHEQESSNYHGIGVVEGVNHGVDPGKWQVYKHVGAQGVLADRRADIFFIWDPDGDRFNMVTTAPVALAAEARAAGLEIDPLDSERCLVFFRPNQIYFMLTALRLASLQATGKLGSYDWIVATTFPTSRSISELARSFNARHGAGVKTFQVPVGFKHFAALVGSLEEQLERTVGGSPRPQARADQPAKQAGGGREGAPTTSGTPATRATDVTGNETVFGPRPRLLIMAEESGGAALGPAEPMQSRNGRRHALAAKEKDAMQVGVLALTLAARLHNSRSSFAAYYLDLLREYGIRYRFYERQDVTLFDEALQGEAREVARAAGNARKAATVAFFTCLEELAPANVGQMLQSRLPTGVHLPPVKHAFHAGDGTLIEMDGMWFELRASGTDAVLRYYMEGRDQESVSRLNTAFTQLDIPNAETDET